MKEGVIARVAAWLLALSLLVAAIFLVLPSASAGHSSGVAPGVAVVDGDPSEWDLAHDHFAPLIRAGGQGGQTQVLGHSYLRYDCATSTLFVLALAADDLEVRQSAGDAWVKIDEFGVGNSADQTSFEWVFEGSTLKGFEAAVAGIPPGAYTIEIHQDVEPNGDTSSSGKVGSDLDIACDSTTTTSTSTTVTDSTPGTDSTTSTTAATTTSPPPAPTTTAATATSPPPAPTTTESSLVGNSSDITVAGVFISTTSVAVAAETLPFTGPSLGDGGFAGVAMALLALGGMVVLGVRRRDEAPIVERGWAIRLPGIE